MYVLVLKRFKLYEAKKVTRSLSCCHGYLLLFTFKKFFKYLSLKRYQICSQKKKMVGTWKKFVSETWLILARTLKKVAHPGLEDGNLVM